MSNTIGKGDRFRIENETRTRQPGKWGKGLKWKEKDLNKNEKERSKKTAWEMRKGLKEWQQDNLEDEGGAWKGMEG